MRAESVLHSFRYALNGVWYVFRTQRNAKIHLFVTLIVLVLGTMVQISAKDWAILLITIGLVFSAEILNTTVESIVDLVSPNFHPLAQIAKDTAAGSVFILAISAVGVGLLILGPPLWTRLPVFPAIF